MPGTGMPVIPERTNVGEAEPAWTGPYTQPRGGAGAAGGRDELRVSTSSKTWYVTRSMRWSMISTATVSWRVKAPATQTTRGALPSISPAAWSPSFPRGQALELMDTISRAGPRFAGQSKAVTMDSMIARIPFQSACASALPTW